MTVDRILGPQVYPHGPIGSSHDAGYGQIDVVRIGPTGNQFETKKVRAGLWSLKVIATSIFAIPFALFRVTGDENTFDENHATVTDAPAEPVTAFVPRVLWLSKNAEIKIHVAPNTALFMSLLSLPESDQ